MSADEVATTPKRVSDADRERAAERVYYAAGQGQLDLGEVDERLRRVYAAATTAELTEVVGDLMPVEAGQVVRPAPPATGAWAVAVAGTFKREGRWTMPPVLTAVVSQGSGRLDLSSALMTGDTATIRAFVTMGTLKVILADDMVVDVAGRAISGWFSNDAGAPTTPGVRRLRVTGFALWGGVKIVRRKR